MTIPMFKVISSTGKMAVSWTSPVRMSSPYELHTYQESQSHLFTPAVVRYLKDIQKACASFKISDVTVGGSAEKSLLDTTVKPNDIDLFFWGEFSFTKSSQGKDWEFECPTLEKILEKMSPKPVKRVISEHWALYSVTLEDGTKLDIKCISKASPGHIFAFSTESEHVWLNDFLESGKAQDIRFVTVGPYTDSDRNWLADHNLRDCLSPLRFYSDRTPCVKEDKFFRWMLESTRNPDFSLLNPFYEQLIVLGFFSDLYQSGFNHAFADRIKRQCDSHFPGDANKSVAFIITILQTVFHYQDHLIHILGNDGYAQITKSIYESLDQFKATVAFSTLDFFPDQLIRKGPIVPPERLEAWKRFVSEQDLQKRIEQETAVKLKPYIPGQFSWLLSQDVPPADLLINGQVVALQKGDSRTTLIQNTLNRIDVVVDETETVESMVILSLLYGLNLLLTLKTETPESHFLRVTSACAPDPNAAFDKQQMEHLIKTCLFAMEQAALPAYLREKCANTLETLSCFLNPKSSSCSDVSLAITVSSSSQVDSHPESIITTSLGTIDSQESPLVVSPCEDSPRYSQQQLSQMSYKSICKFGITRFLDLINESLPQKYLDTLIEKISRQKNPAIKDLQALVQCFAEGRLISIAKHGAKLSAIIRLCHAKYPELFAKLMKVFPEIPAKKALDPDFKRILLFKTLATSPNELIALLLEKSPQDWDGAESLFLSQKKHLEALAATLIQQIGQNFSDQFGQWLIWTAQHLPASIQPALQRVMQELEPVAPPALPRASFCTSLLQSMGILSQPKPAVAEDRYTKNQLTVLRRQFIQLGLMDSHFIDHAAPLFEQAHLRPYVRDILLTLASDSIYVLKNTTLHQRDPDTFEYHLGRVNDIVSILAPIKTLQLSWAAQHSLPSDSMMGLLQEQPHRHQNFMNALAQHPTQIWVDWTQVIAESLIRMDTRLKGKVKDKSECVLMHMNTLMHLKRLFNDGPFLYRHVECLEQLLSNRVLKLSIIDSFKDELVVLEAHLFTSNGVVVEGSSEQSLILKRGTYLAKLYGDCIHFQNGERSYDPYLSPENALTEVELLMTQRAKPILDYHRTVLFERIITYSSETRPDQLVKKLIDSPVLPAFKDYLLKALGDRCDEHLQYWVRLCAAQDSHFLEKALRLTEQKNKRWKSEDYQHLYVDLTVIKAKQLNASHFKLGGRAQDTVFYHEKSD